MTERPRGAAGGSPGAAGGSSGDAGGSSGAADGAPALPGRISRLPGGAGDAQAATSSRAVGARPGQPRSRPTPPARPAPAGGKRARRPGRRRHPLPVGGLVLVAALVVFVLVTVDVLVGGPLTHLDTTVSAWARSTGLPGAGWHRPGQKEADQLVNLGDREVVGIIVLIAIGWICVRARTALPLLRLAALAGVTASIVLALKYGIGRPAPSGVQGPEAFHSYPSGHTATAVILWGTLYSVVAEHEDQAVSRQVAWLLSWLAPVLVMVGMVLRDYHWITDLVGAAALCTVLLQAERLALRHWRGARRGPESAARPRDGSVALGTAPGPG